MRLAKYIIPLWILGFSNCQKTKKSNDDIKPNIVIIYADDMGYGDLACQNPDSKIPTPNLDQLASEGMRFTDAHSSSGICSPSRFALLTGQYHWRRQHQIVESFGPPMFWDGDITLPQILKDVGYFTACIGKWHMGWNWDFNEGAPSGERDMWGKMRPVYMLEDLNFSESIKGGPLDRGFDYYFGDGTINFPPYAWIENDQMLEKPTEFVEHNGFSGTPPEGNWGSRPGPMVKDWDPYKVLPTLTSKATEFINQQEKDKPYFLYFALPSPHEPVIPNKEFLGKSDAGAYGDFMFQTDWVAGQVLKAIKEKGLEDNTVVIFTSDNGPERTAFERAENYDHFSMGKFRGLKRDVWEGGHHVPFIVKWPGNFPSGSVNNSLISQIDIMTTLAQLTNAEIPEGGAPDSRNFSAVWKGDTPEQPIRKSTVHNTYKNHYALRDGKWLYINSPTGEVSKMTESFKKLRAYEDFDTEGLLFDMSIDPEQRNNLYAQEPEIVSQMKQMLEEEIKGAVAN